MTADRGPYAELPWARFPPPDEIPQIVADIADAAGRGLDAFEQTVREWRATAEVHADPELLRRLTGPTGDDYGGVAARRAQGGWPMSLTVKQLRDQIASLADDTLVILAKDGEGNEFSPLKEIDSGAHYAAESAWSGEVTGSDDEPHDEQGVPCVVLWPTN